MGKEKKKEKQRASSGHRRRKIKAVDPFARPSDKANTDQHIRPGKRERPFNKAPSSTDLDVVFENKELMEGKETEKKERKLSRKRPIAPDGHEITPEEVERMDSTKKRRRLDGSLMPTRVDADGNEVENDGNDAAAAERGMKLEGMKKGETWNDFNSRMRKESHELVVNQIRARKGVSARRKEYLRTKMEKEREKEDRRTVLLGEKLQGRADLRREVKFGEQVKEPPNITVLPRGANKIDKIKTAEHPLRSSVIDNWRKLKAQRIANASNAAQSSSSATS
eukprot:ANDGO_04764.mRNA.1 hypothetical protein